jgi:hypothetical protein
MDVRLVIRDLRWDTLADAVKFPIRVVVTSLHGKNVFFVFL